MTHMLEAEYPLLPLISISEDVLFLQGAAIKLFRKYFYKKKHKMNILKLFMKKSKLCETYIY